MKRLVGIVTVLFFVCPCTFLYAQQPAGLKFIENKNQWADDIDFAARVPGGQLFVSPTQFSVYLIDQQAIDDRHHHSIHGDADESTGQPANAGDAIQGHFILVSFLNANSKPQPRTFGKSTSYYNYFIGNDANRWASRAHAYAEIIYPDVYAGIDVRITSVNENLKYDFIVHPEVSPASIQIAYNGADGLYLDNGNLMIETSLGTLIEKKPYAYQEIDGYVCEVPSAYKLEGDVLHFVFLEGYDHCYELIIDPLLIFSTYSGSTADNWGSTATPGERGTLYSSGITNETGGGKYPATPGTFQTNYGGIYDIAILKYDSTGSQLLYASYLGGTSNETPHSLVMDSVTHDLLVLGSTSSANYPVSAQALDNTFNGGTTLGTNVISYANGVDIVVSRISATGDRLISSTFLGGSANDGVNPPGGPLTRNYGDEMRGDIITDKNGYVYISSVTSSTDFPVANSFQITYGGGVTDAVLVKLTPDLSSVVWGTFLGGSEYDASHTLKFDSRGNIYIAGGTTSTGFPVTDNAYQKVLAGGADGWLAKVLKDGSSIAYATFTGTPGFDQVYFVDLNRNDEVFVYGQTNGSMPVTSGAYRNPNSGQFVQKFTHELNSIMFSTVFGSGGGIPNISPTAFLVNDCNNLYLSGWGGRINNGLGYWNSNTIGMPTTTDAIQRTSTGSDFYFMVLTADATELLYATYLGGTQSRTHVDGGTSRFDKSGIVYHAVCSGCASLNASGEATSDFPTTPGAWSRLNRSNNCNNAAFKFDLSSLRARIQTNSVTFNAPGLDKICWPDPIRFQNLSSGGETYQWDLGDGTALVKADTTSFVHQYVEPGDYTVTLRAIDQSTCTGVDVAHKVVHVYPNNGKAQDDLDICFGTEYTLSASGGAVYAWSLKDQTIITPTVTPEDTTTYYVKITTADGCVKHDSVQVNVVPFIDLDFSYRFVTDCFSRPAVAVRNRTKAKADETYIFNFSDGFTTDADETVHAFAEDNTYTVKLSGIKEFCVYEKEVTLPVYTLKVPNIFTPTVSAGINDTFFIQYGENLQEPAAIGLKVDLKIVNRWGSKVYESADYRNDWTASNIDAGIYYYHLQVGPYAECKGWLQVVK